MKNKIHVFSFFESLFNVWLLTYTGKPEKSTNIVPIQVRGLPFSTYSPRGGGRGGGGA